MIATLVYVAFMAIIAYYISNLEDGSRDDVSLMVEAGSDGDYMTDLKGKGKVKGKTTKTKKGKGIIGEFGAGVLLICFALPMVWMNERKQVKIYQLIQKGKAKCQNADANEIQQDNEKALVCVAGPLQTNEIVEDAGFGLQQDNLVKIKRTVEVFQWVEHVKQENSGDEVETKRSYEREWSSTYCDQGQYMPKEELEGTNPSNWAFSTEEFRNSELNLGQFRINNSQIDRMNQYERIQLEETHESMIEASTDTFTAQGWQAPTYEGGYIYARREGAEGEGPPQIGDMRVSFERVPCTDFTVIAQQINNKDQITTFRTWNPEKEDLEFGGDTNQEVAASCPMWCLPCFITEFCFKALAQETIDSLTPGIHSKDDIFDQMDADNAGQTVCIRWVAYIMNVVGHILIWMPLINLVSSIPFVGWLLGGALYVAVVVFGCLWATMLHCIVLAVAWIVYRPLVGLALLACVAVCIGVMMYTPAGAPPKAKTPVKKTT